MAHLDLATGTYEAAERRLHGRDSVRIGHNTRLERRREAGRDHFAIRYHATDILTMTPDGWTIIDTRGWWTVTTWSRINALLPGPWAVYSARGLRHLHYAGQPVARYLDGIAIHFATGAVGIREDRYRYAVGRIMTPDAVGDAVREGERKAAERAAKRAERQRRQHDGEADIAEVRRVADRIAEAYEAGREPLALHTETFAAYVASPHGRARDWDCDLCAPRRAILREYQTRTLAAIHAHAVRLVGVTSPPSMAEVRRLADTVGQPWGLILGHIGTNWDPIHNDRLRDARPVAITCPWDCPSKGTR
jgi:hypothetical protein